jgi:hypothetical protein
LKCEDEEKGGIGNWKEAGDRGQGAEGEEVLFYSSLYFLLSRFNV